MVIDWGPSERLLYTARFPAPHRPAAFAACRYVIDELKVRAPIWKRIIYADGAAEWVDGRDPVRSERPA